MKMQCTEDDFTEDELLEVSEAATKESGWSPPRGCAVESVHEVMRGEFDNQGSIAVERNYANAVRARLQFILNSRPCKTCGHAQSLHQPPWTGCTVPKPSGAGGLCGCAEFVPTPSDPAVVRIYVPALDCHLTLDELAAADEAGALAAEKHAQRHYTLEQRAECARRALAGGGAESYRKGVLDHLAALRAAKEKAAASPAPSDAAGSTNASEILTREVLATAASATRAALEAIEKDDHFSLRLAVSRLVRAAREADAFTFTLVREVDAHPDSHTIPLGGGTP